MPIPCRILLVRHFLRLSLIFSIAISGLAPLAARAQSDQVRQAAAQDTIDLLNSPERLKTLSDPKAAAALEHVNRLLPDPETRANLMSLSGDIFKALVDKGFTEEQLAKIIEEAQRNPAGLKQHLSPSQINEIKTLARPLEGQSGKP